MCCTEARKSDRRICLSKFTGSTIERYRAKTLHDNTWYDLTDSLHNHRSLGIKFGQHDTHQFRSHPSLFGVTLVILLLWSDDFVGQNDHDKSTLSPMKKAKLPHLSDHKTLA